MIDNHNKWTASRDEEFWNDDEYFDTREEAIAYGLKRAKKSGWTVFYVGQVKTVEIMAGGLAEGLIEGINIDHYNEHGELAENFLSSVDKDHIEILDEKLEEVIRAWADEYGYQPDYFVIESAEEICVNGGVDE